MKFTTFVISCALAGLSLAQKESDYYTITTFPTPRDSVVEVGAVDFGPDGRVYLCTRRGEIWSVGNAFGEPEKADWKLFARYLHEPLGLAWKDDWLYVTQRPEVSRIQDEDGDGRADLFETVSADWGITGNYHEYAFGSRFDKDGNIWNVLCLTGSFTSETLYRGWILRVDENGNMTPTVCGVRSPGGISIGPEGDVFYTDNQGAWNGTSALKHAKVGSFQGNPNGNVWFEFAGGAIGEEPPHPAYIDDGRTAVARMKIPTYVPPAIMLPHGKIGQSPTGIAYDETGGKFGPFSGQLFVGEQTYSQVQRCFLEKVNGVWQGAAFHFMSGFKSGNIGVRLHESGALFTGGSSRGWSARGGKSFSFERVDWTGKVPFEVHEMRARQDGFELTFTKPVDPSTAVDSSLSMSAYTYKYRPAYGSPEVDNLTPKVTVTSVSEDGKTVRINVDPLTKGHIHELKLGGIKSTEGLPLLHQTGYYTLNEIPGS